MYTPPMFKPDRAASLAWAQARGFGTITAWDGSKPVASPLPFHLAYANDGAPIAAFHVARQNPLANLADGKSRWLIAVTGAHAYVSADWYVSADQVPTWLYQAVHLTGIVRMLSGQELGPHLDELSANFEASLAPKPAWAVSKVTPGRLDALKKGIVGLVMSVEEVEGSFKLNQQKSDIDHLAVATALARQPEAGARAMANEMRALRPQLFAADATQDTKALPEGTMS
jgi:transcriptional regulator